MTVSSKEANRMDAGRQVWNSLEICKLIATIMTPLMVFVLGCLIWNNQREIIQRWEADQVEQRRLGDAASRERERIREFRLLIYKEAAPMLDEILSYHFYVGRWKEHSPLDIIEKKRQLDSLMYSNIALFTPAFFDSYRAFMRQAFRAAGNHFGESRIRTQAQCRRPHINQDTERWIAHFTHEDTRRDLCLAYANLLGRLSEELLLQSIRMPNQTDAEKLSLCPPIYDSERC
ncbi:MAG: hypothetical protein HYX38_06095 [Rhodospirillales bacterium]|nr:hypothetical protein [Rhodospirillales bacterium]